MKHIIFTAFAFLALAIFTDANAATRINYPKWNGYALDWCKTFENGCGAPAADLYCQKRGSARSVGFQILPSVSVQTMTVGQNAICNPSVHRCDSFKYIDCEDAVKTFNYPSVSGYRLDWCRMFGTECGAPAAHTYCQKKGYAQSINFARQNDVGVQTLIIGNNSICNPSFTSCDSFSFITCKK